MNKTEFLNKLKEALENDLSGRIVQEQLIYYNDYITEEVSKGRSEETVVSELGDPWVLAKTVVDSVELQGNTYGSNTVDGEESGTGRADHQSSSRSTGSHSESNYGVPKWKLWVIIAMLILIVVCIITVIVGVVSSLWPIIFPVLIIWLVIRFMGRS